MAEKLKLTDPNWMVWRVLRKDKVKTNAEPVEYSTDHVARTVMNLFKGLVLGYNGVYRVLPDKSVTKDVDYTHLHKGMGGFYPPELEEKMGKVVRETYYHKRYGRVVRPTNRSRKA